MQWYKLSPQEVCKYFKVNINSGLSSQEALNRIKKYGENFLPEKNKLSFFKILLNQFLNPMIVVLIIGLIITVLTGQWLDFIAILAIILVNSIIGFIQEYKAEQALSALQNFITEKSSVIRDGSLQFIDSKKLVPGDIVLINSGDVIATDGRILQVIHLAINEASLTGEAFPIFKTKKVIHTDSKIIIADQINMVFKGTQVVSGKGSYIVTETGLNTQLGNIALQIKKIDNKKTPLQIKIDNLSFWLISLAIAVAALIFFIGIIKKSNLIDLLLTAVTLAIASIPEGLPAVITVTLALGAQAMARKNALFRRLSSIETLGSVSVICTDKTGTLTQSNMTATFIWLDNTLIKKEELDYSKCPDIEQALTIAALCNESKIYSDNNNQIKMTGDPTEIAILQLAYDSGFNKNELEKKWPRIDEIPFDPKKKLMFTLNQFKNENQIFVKGAPDILIKYCSYILINGKIEPINLHVEKILEANQYFAHQTLRVLALGYKIVAKEIKALSPELLNDFIFVTLIALDNPIRPEVPKAIETAKKAGIKIVVITGDHKETVLALAKKLNLLNANALTITGVELDEMSDLQLKEKIDQILIYARVSPEHKMRIVDALQSKNQIVAMTGDGINDAPAIKAADIGIAMGITGTQITKQAADLILLDDNFASIINAIKQGRGIYDNIVKFVSYLVSSNIAEIIVILIGSLLTTKFSPLLPIQILWINLITDGLPAIALAMDPIDPKIMSRPPKKTSSSLITPNLLKEIILMSLILSVGALIVYYYFIQISISLAHTSILTIFVIFAFLRAFIIQTNYNLNFFSNSWLLLSLIISLILQLSIIYIKPLQIIFKTEPLSLYHWLILIIVTAIVSIISIFANRIFIKQNIME